MLPETVQFRRDNRALTESLARDWVQVWRLLDVSAVDRSFPRWMVAVLALTGRYRGASAAVAARYLATLTGYAAEAGPLVDPARFVVSMRVTALVGVKVATRNGLSVSEASATALAASLRASSRYVLDAGRDVVAATAAADPSARGWRRVGVGECDTFALV